MKSPFPGMDPYLEDQGRWPDFHASMITYCRDAISRATAFLRTMSRRWVRK